MNIFFLHLDPEECAKMHVDKHVVKMLIEHCQLLSSAHYITESEYKPPYKLTHKNHPCAIWTRESLSNYKYLVQLTKELCKEYTYRYGKIHKCQSILDLLEVNLPPIEDIGFTKPRQAMPVEYKEEDSVMAYRNYYFYEKQHIHAWKKRDPPEWLNDYLL